jgi:cytochrome c5
MLGVLDEAVTASLAAHEPFALLVDVTGAAMTSEWLMAIKKHSRDVWAPRVSRCAVLGVGGLKAAMLRGFNAVGGGMRAVPVASQERAVAWLGGDTR